MRSFLFGLFLLVPGISVAQDGLRTSCLPKDIKGLLLEVEARFGKVTIQSALREGELTAILRLPSKHAQCKAVDFIVAGDGNQASAAKWLMGQPYEVIVYTGRMNFIHLAVGYYKAYRTIGPRATDASPRSRMFASYP